MLRLIVSIVPISCLLGGLRAAEAPLALPAAAQAHLAAGSKVIEMATGDLNADGRADLVFVGEATDPGKITKDPHNKDEFLNQNPRVLVILLADKEGYRKVGESAKFIPPAFVPELDNFLDRLSDIKVAKGVLSVKFNWFSTIGSWSVSLEEFKFRFEGSRMRLIGKEVDTFYRNSGDKTLVSSNYLNGKIKRTSGLNEFDENESHPEVTWEDLKSRKPVYLEDLPPCGRKE
jgi:hypothetical protein